MPYTYHVEFDLAPDQARLLEVGGDLEVIAATLKTRLPDEAGMVSSRTLYSVDRPGAVHVIFESLWEDWDDLEAHREGPLDEHKYVSEWAPPGAAGPMSTHVYRQTGI